MFNSNAYYLGVFGKGLTVSILSVFENSQGNIRWQNSLFDVIGNGYQVRVSEQTEIYL
jgi:hypothetical protein